MNYEKKVHCLASPLVSVAIITYNQKFYLKECIESILSQDYCNIEIIVADDASTDGTVTMLQAFKEEHPDKFILKLADKNQGLTRNSNIAHSACSGKYVAWMGGDDLMLPGKLSKQVAFMELNFDCSISYHNLDVFDSSSNRTLYLLNDKVYPYEGDVRVVIRNQSFNGACSCMVRADRAPVNGFNNLIPFASDWLYWVETLHNGGNISYINEVLGRYRRHDQNITKIGTKIGQNDIDHLNTCNFIIAINPNYFGDAMIAYSKRILNMRHKLPYRQAVISSLRINFTIKAAAALMIYLITFSRLKI